MELPHHDNSAKLATLLRCPVTGSVTADGYEGNLELMCSLDK